MKKILAMLSAAVLGCCMHTAPAFAADEAAPETEQTYQLGDVDMDGEITTRDAQLTLIAYVKLMALQPCKLTKQQAALSHVGGIEEADRVYVEDAQAILMYSVKKLAGFDDKYMESFFADYTKHWQNMEMGGCLLRNE